MSENKYKKRNPNRLSLSEGESDSPFHQQVCIGEECASFGAEPEEVEGILGALPLFTVGGEGGVYKPKGRAGEEIEGIDVSPQKAKIIRDYLNKLVEEGREGDYSINPLVGEDCRDFSQREYKTLKNFVNTAPDQETVNMRKMKKEIEGILGGRGK